MSKKETVKTVGRKGVESPKTRHVLAALWMAGKFGQGLFSGILRHVEEHPEWNIELVRTWEAFCSMLDSRLADGSVDGIITCYTQLPAVEALLKSDIPMVAIDFPENNPIYTRRKRIGFVMSDAADIGQKAAEVFLAQGMFRSYGFVHSISLETHQRDYWSVHRSEAFRKGLGEMGKVCSECDVQGDSTGPLVSWLKDLPKPAGVFAACDDCAVQVVAACREAGLSVPRSVAVLGVDNDLLLCEHSLMTISSIEPDFIEEGYQASRMLEELMSRGPEDDMADIPRVACGAKRIVRRQTTVPVSMAGKLVQQAISFINAHACDGIQVQDVADHLKVSRRLLDLRFHQLQGETIHTAIQECRLQRVRELLLTTRDSISSITSECGYESETSLKNLFKRHYRMTMGEYRRLRSFLK